MRRFSLRWLGTPIVLGGLAAAALVVSGGSRGSGQSRVEAPAASDWRGLVGMPRPPVAVGQRVLVVLRAPSLAGQVAGAGGLASDGDERRWTAAAAAAQQQLVADLATKGVALRPEFRYTRVLNGFSAAVDPRALALIDREPGVEGVYPVRAAYPAALARSRLPRDFFARGLGRRPDVSLGDFDGQGVTIALLDTGVDLTTPFLHGHVLRGIDIVDNGPDARARARPDRHTALERHGTEMAGLLVGADGPAGLAGVASSATVLPIRVAGWQRNTTGSFAVYARTDQILAGLEHAVDPNGDGDAHDAARIALVPLAQPFAAFTDDPLARAAAGALQLDMLVVAPAGNDGPAGPSFGNVSGPGGAPAVLTVGSADLRSKTAMAQLVVRVGLHVLLNRSVPLAGAAGPPRTLDLELAAPRRLLDRSGFSVVAGRAALLRATGSPEQIAESAAAAGAAAVLLHGNVVPAGALGLDEDAPIPVLTIPETIARALLAAVRQGKPVTVALGPIRTRPNGELGTPAPFTSWGFNFAGQLKPDLLASGVGVITAEPAAGGAGSPFATINGSSAAAAVAAGAAAVLLQARPSLDAAALKSVLVGSARRLLGEPPQAQGAGLVHVLSAAGVEFAAEPATIAFGRAGGDGWQSSRTLVLRNLSTRELTVYAASGQGPHPRVALSLGRRRLLVPAGGEARLTVRARVVGYPRGAVAAGRLTLTPVGGEPLRVPWSALLGPEPADLLGSVSLSDRSFAPSEVTPALLSLRAGRVVRRASGDSIEPVRQLDLVLSNVSGKRVGLLARLRDLLPGRYAFGLTGRGPAGAPLAPGLYRLRIVAWPTTHGPPSVASVGFEIVGEAGG